MAYFKGVYFFRQFSQGWTETYFRQGASIPDVQSGFKHLAGYLIGPRADETTLDAVRISQENSPTGRVAKLVAIGLPGLRPPGSVGNEAQDVVQTCELMRIGASDGSSQPHMIRGLYDPDVGRKPDSGLPNPSAALVVSNNFLLSAFISDVVSVRRFDRTQPAIFVTQISATTIPGFTSIGVPVGHPFTIGMRVRFTGVPLTRVPWLKGQWTVLGVGPTYFNIGYNYPLPAPISPTNMFAIPVVYNYPVITSFEFLDFRSRKTGRPTNLTRGRARGIPFRRSSRVGG